MYGMCVWYVCMIGAWYDMCVWYGVCLYGTCVWYGGCMVRVYGMCVWYVFHGVTFFIIKKT